MSLRSLLQTKHCSRLKANVSPDVLGNLADEALEGGLADKKVGGLLVLADLAKGYGARAVAVGLLDATISGSGCELPG